MQQTSYLEGGPLMWMLPMYLHVNKKSDDDDDDDDDDDMTNRKQIYNITASKDNMFFHAV